MLKINKTSDRTCWVEYRDGFEVELRYMPRTAMQAIRKQCTVKHWDPKTHQPVEEMKDELLWHALAAQAVVNWRGLTPAVLHTMVDMDEYPTTDEPFTVESCAALLAGAYDFDIWVQSTAMELAVFDATARVAQGNAAPPAPDNSAAGAAVES